MPVVSQRTILLFAPAPKDTLEMLAQAAVNLVPSQSQDIRDHYWPAMQILQVLMKKQKSNNSISTEIKNFRSHFEASFFSST